MGVCVYRALLIGYHAMGGRGGELYEWERIGTAADAQCVCVCVCVYSFPCWCYVMNRARKSKKSEKQTLRGRSKK